MKKFARKMTHLIGEKKYLVRDTGGYVAVGIFGNLTKLSDVPQGDTSLTRDGSQLSIRSLEFDFTIYSSGIDNTIRIIIFQWFPDDTVAPIVTDILTSPAGSFLTNAYYNHDNRFNYRILYDKRFSFSTIAGPMYKPAQRIMIGKFPRRRIQFQNVGVNGSCHIYSITVSDDAVVPQPTIAWVSKFNFSDN